MGESKDKFNGDRSDLDDIADQLAERNMGNTGNGNNESLPESKPGGAQKGGPGIEKAKDHQPPDAVVGQEK